jgi:hypothetical protein
MERYISLTRPYFHCNKQEYQNLKKYLEEIKHIFNRFLLVYMAHSIAQDRMHQRINMYEYVNNLVVRGDLGPNTNQYLGKYET